MQGRLTSSDPSRNRHGVLYSDLLREVAANHANHVAALVNALRAWVEYDAAYAIARKKGYPPGKTNLAKELRELAFDLTRRALL